MSIITLAMMMGCAGASVKVALRGALRHECYELNKPLILKGNLIMTPIDKSLQMYFPTIP